MCLKGSGDVGGGEKTVKKRELKYTRSSNLLTLDTKSNKTTVNSQQLSLKKRYGEKSTEYILIFRISLKINENFVVCGFLLNKR